MQIAKADKVVILGGGESGVGAAVLAATKGFEVFLSDSGTLAADYKQILDRHSIIYEEGEHSENKLMDASLAVKSPGIPDSAVIVRLLRSADIPVISEIEFAGRFTEASKTICITGSNGKTTMTTLLYKILSDAGYDVGLGGNIGKSFAYMVATRPHEWYVLELSSFQLDGMNEFKADIAVLLNITPDHLDRYDWDMNKYIASKMRIIANQTYDDYFIYSADDHNINQVLPRYDLQMRILPFTASRTVKRTEDGHRHSRWHGAHTDGELLTAVVGERTLSIDSSKVRLKGKHNLYNMMAATLAAMAAGVEDDSIRASLETFPGVENRLEKVGEIAGVEYYNDSKATNVDAALSALEAMDRPVVWIAGGTDKGNDYTTLHPHARSKVKALVAMGLDNAKIIDSFESVIPVIHNCKTISEALETAAAEANEGDVVLLSPACASFDLFKNYEERGRQFREWVTAHPDFQPCSESKN